MPILTLKNDAQVSPKDFIQRADGLFQLYLVEEEQRVDEKVKKPSDRAERRQEIDLLQRIFRTRKSLSELLRGAFIKGEIDWESEEVLSAEELAAFIEQVAYFSDQYYNRNYSRYQLVVSRQGGGTPLAFLGRELLEDETIGVDHMLIIMNFRKYLRNCYLIEEETGEEKAKGDLFEVKCEFHAGMTMLIQLIWVAGLDEESQRKWVHSLLAVMGAKDLEAARLSSFMERCEGLFEQFPEEEADKETGIEEIRKIMVSLEGVFKEVLAGYWQETVAEEKYKMVVIGDESGKGIYLLSVNNFYFNAGEDGDCCEIDIFPRNGEKAPRSRYPELVGDCKDVSVFNGNGRKVYWGDLLPEDIEGLKGVYYVLSQMDSFHDVPKFVIKAESMKAADDFLRPKDTLIPVEEMARDKVALDPDYVRMKALGKIKNGEFVKNG